MRLANPSTNSSTNGSTKRWASEYANAKSWEASTRVLMLASKALFVLEETQRTTANEVKGCESRVWLDAVCVNEHIEFKGFSEGKIVRGLIQLIFEPIQSTSISEFSRFDFDDYLSTLNLQKHLSPSRTNGVNGLVKHLKLMQRGQTFNHGST